MNKDQRKYLTDLVVKTHREQSDAIKNELPNKPSLNNYLVAACLDDTIQLQDIYSIKNKIKTRVLGFGHSDALVKEGDDYSFSRSSRRNRDKNIVELEAEDIFVVPKAYTEALQEYERIKQDVDNRIRLLESQKDTIVMKIQIGSDQSLSKLISEVDNIADLSLVNSSLLLTDKTDQKQIGQGSKKK